MSARGRGLMRLHHLELTAFGPFAGQEQVNFDTLSDAGLFLLCGPTGSGKTSVLDAVTFALFGQVPGDRDKAKRLRSDHADPAAAPRVRLDVTLRGRRMRITRSPEWLRPKKRGTGTTREQARILVEERQDGAWQQRTNRIDEAGDLLGRLVGMTMSQFCQVAMLPQGRFETFLTAGGQERHQLLERIFDAGRFRAVEDWLAEQRTALSRRSAEHESAVSALLARICEASGAPEPDVDAALAWAEAQRDRAVADLAVARARRTEAEQAAKLAHAELDEMRRRAELRRRHGDAIRRLELLDGLADSTRDLQQQVDAARRAEAVLNGVELLEEQTRSADRARLGFADAVRAAAQYLDDSLHDRLSSLLDEPEPPTPRDSEVVAAVAAARRRHAQLVALLPAQDELDRLQGQLGDTHTAVAEQQRRCTALDHRLAGLAEEIAAADSARQADEQATAALPGLLDRLTAAEQRLRAARTAAELETAQTALVARHQEATGAVLDRRGTWLDRRERRLAGMAAELAAGLEPGHACPVCGSAQHPRPAAAAADAVDAAAEEAALEELRRAEHDCEQATSRLREHERRLAAARAAASGHDVEAAERQVADLHASVAAAQQARRRIDGAAAAVADLRARREQAERDRQHAAAEAARLQAHAQHLQERLVRLEDELSVHVAAGADLYAELAVATAAVSAVEEVDRALSTWAQAQAAAATCTERVATQLRRHGFADRDAVRRAWRPAAGLANHEALLQQRAEERRDAERVLADPAVRAAAELLPADVAGCEQALVRLERARDAAVSEHAGLAVRADRLERLVSELGAAMAAWEPVRAAHRTAADLAGLCAGTSADNPDRIRLSSYVLAARLAQVVAAANEQLDRMTAGRYQLEHTDARGVGDRKGGLGLRVRDGWTGESRDPVTLSGGETFIASLALALGLADVVAHEAGRAQLGTLFVDEGFGSLDPDTLDEVMDVLDDLRSGGRVVGLVSHVTELQARITTRLRVTKTRRGSRLVSA